MQYCMYCRSIVNYAVMHLVIRIENMASIIDRKKIGIIMKLSRKRLSLVGRPFRM